MRLHLGEQPLEGEALVAAAEGCALIVSYRQSPAPASLFDSLPGLVAFLRCAVDIRNVDVAAASRAGVLVTQASAGFVPAVAELVFGFLIDLSRGISHSGATYRAGGIPAARSGKHLRGSVLGVIGYGAIGREVARIGVAFGMRVLVCDPHVKVAPQGVEQPGIEQPGIEQLGFDALLANADYVVPLAVATPETENLMDAAAFAKMKSGAFFVNVSRGNLVDEVALEAALASRRIAACALDVGRAPDQMPTPRLAALDRVIATPHVGGLTPQAIEHQSLETAAQAAEIGAGRAPKGAVNAEYWTRQELLGK